jgi:hypothetical protein
LRLLYEERFMLVVRWISKTSGSAPIEGIGGSAISGAVDDAVDFFVVEPLVLLEGGETLDGDDNGTWRVWKRV